MEPEIVFVSNYINHHQIPFCDAMYRRTNGSFLFIQTEPMEEERVRMGWKPQEDLPYLRFFEREPDLCRTLILDSQVVLFGGTDEEAYIQPRLRAGRPVVRYSERLYKEAQWKAVSPRGLVKKYEDHVRYRNAPVYLLCAGAYVPDDFHIIRAYPGKMYRWGYFPEKKEYDLEKLFAGKGYGPDRLPYLLWAARFLDWKHPELALLTAKTLKGQGIAFHLDMAGGGELKGQIQEWIDQEGLADVVSLVGYRTPEEIRSMMEKADLYLMTSDRKEGWGAVVNEAMNSGCVVLADHMAGAVPYLVKHGENGIIYQDGRPEELFAAAVSLAGDRGRRRKLGEAAYRTITEVWNPDRAAASLLALLGELGLCAPRMLCGQEMDPAEVIAPDGPCSPAPVIPERKMYRFLCG